MKYGWVVLLLLVGVMTPRAAQAQVSAYGEFSGTLLANLNQTDNLYGATTGVIFDGPHWGRHILASGDVQGRFVRKSGESLNGVTIGPRFQFPIHGGSWSPFAEFMVGFARYHDDGTNAGAQYNGSTTDATMQINGGLAKKVSPHWDVVADFSYAQYYALGGQFNPKTYGAGVVYHFTKR